MSTDYTTGIGCARSQFMLSIQCSMHCIHLLGILYGSPAELLFKNDYPLVHTAYHMSHINLKTSAYYNIALGTAYKL